MKRLIPVLLITLLLCTGCLGTRQAGRDTAKQPITSAEAQLLMYRMMATAVSAPKPMLVVEGTDEDPATVYVKAKKIAVYQPSQMLPEPNFSYPPEHPLYGMITSSVPWVAGAYAIPRIFDAGLDAARPVNGPVAPAE